MYAGYSSAIGIDWDIVFPGRRRRDEVDKWKKQSHWWLSISSSLYFHPTTFSWCDVVLCVDVDVDSSQDKTGKTHSPRFIKCVTLLRPQQRTDRLCVRTSAEGFFLLKFNYWLGSNVNVIPWSLLLGRLPLAGLSSVIILAKYALGRSLGLVLC